MARMQIEVQSHIEIEMPQALKIGLTRAGAAGYIS